jgi:hypothetical protein
MSENSYIVLKRYQYQVNALFAADELKSNNIECKENQENKGCDILVLEKNYAKALLLIEKLDLDDSYVDKSSDGYIEGLQEWSDHRLNPGYWIARSKLPHWAMDKKNYLYFGPLLLIAGLTGAFLEAKNIGSLTSSDALGIILTLVLLIGGCYTTTAIFKGSAGRK